MSGSGGLLERQTIAADPAASVWVSASAGTGKTHVLTNRVLRLLLAGSRPERILCLTFTKAAAAEMANRIAQRLGRWSVIDDAELAQDLTRLTRAPPGAGDLETARRLFAEVLEAAGGLKVETIHAFSESLLGRFPLEADLAPHFQVMDERTADELLARARDEVLSSDSARAVPLAPALGRLIDDQGYNELMWTLINERSRLARSLRVAGGIDGLVGGLREALGLEAGETAETILRAAAKNDRIDLDGLKRVADAMAQGGVTDARNGLAIATWLEDSKRRVETFEAYRTAFFTAAGERRARLIHKQAVALAPDGEAILSAEASRLEAVEERRRAAEIAAATEILVRLGARLIEAYSALKRSHALLDYDDLILKARDLLARPEVAPWVLYKLDGGLDHILIDEAQDTNPEQWQVIQALAEEFFAGSGARPESRTVFAVGDPKQSIFSFQRADPEAFEAMRRHFEERVPAAGAVWRPVELALSFRSTPAVLSVVDRIFANPAARDGLQIGKGRIRHFPERRGDGGLVEIWPTETPAEAVAQEPWQSPVRQLEADNPMGRLAARIAGQIQLWLDGAEKLAATGRPIEAGDIMILVRRRRPFLEEMVRQLKSREIPVAGADRMILGQQIAVMDLIALGRFLLLPDDDLNLAVVLKGPLLGFGEAALFELAHGRPETASLWRELGRRRGDAPDFAAARERLDGWLAQVDFTAPFDFYAGLLASGGGRRQLLRRLGAEAGDALDEFLDLALDYERTHPPSLQGFLQWLEAGDAEVKRDLEQGKNEVRVMTVHGAKGLQAPIVFLADTVQTPAQSPRILWPPGDAGGGIFWVPRRDLEEPVTRALRLAADAKRDQEYRRLFYVALTRAADRLYIAGWEGRRPRAEGCWYDLALGAMQEIGTEVTLGDGRSVLRVSNPQLGETAQFTQTVAPATAPAPAWIQAPAPAEPSPARPLAPSRPASVEPAVSSPIGADAGQRFRRGNLLHRLLQSLPDCAVAERQAVGLKYLGQAAGDLGPQARQAILDEALGVLDDPDFSALFQPGARAEAPIAGIVGERIISGQIDRLAVSERQVLVVDYKSNRPAPKRVQDVAVAYLAQMAAYRALLRSVYPGRPIRCALLWTEEPRLMHLDDAILDRHVP